MLIVDVSQLLDHLGETQLIEMPYELELVGDDFKVIPPVELKLTLLSTGSSILVQGDIAGTIEAACARCLEPFRYEFAVPVEEEYKRPEDIMSATVKDKELGEEDFVFTIDSEGNIDLSELVRQNIFLSIPLKFVCRANCKGIVKNKDKVKGKESRHGIRKGKEKGAGGDPRLAKLKELKERK